jgi:hypothetical protein
VRDSTAPRRYTGYSGRTLHLDLREINALPSLQHIRQFFRNESNIIGLALDATAVCGLALVGYGLWLVSVSLALIATGAALVCFAFWGAARMAADDQQGQRRQRRRLRLLRPPSDEDVA